MYISRPIFKRKYFEGSKFCTTEVQNGTGTDFRDI